MTTNLTNWLERIPFHPFLYSVAPALALLANNAGEITIDAAWRSLLILTLFGGLLLALLWATVRDWRLAAIVASISIVLLFGYGQLYSFMREQGEIGWGFGRHRYLLPVWVAVFVAILLMLRRHRKRVAAITTVLNLCAVAIVLMPLGVIASYEVQSGAVTSALQDTTMETGNLRPPKNGDPPDVYYIVPDAYARDDYLLANYGFDNEPFLESLEGMGFFIARCSQSNYAQSDLSLSSSLNLDHIENLGEEYRPGIREKRGLDHLILNSRVRSELESLGYSTVAFETGFFYTQLHDADYYYELPKQGTLSEFFDFQGVNGFEAMLIQSSGARVLTDTATATGALTWALPDMNRPRSIYRDRVLFVLDQLEHDRVPSLRGPKFVFVHLVSPHHPYVIDREGGFVNRDTEVTDRSAYVDQLAYLNTRLEKVLKGIIDNSNTEPIIVLQADHGNLPPPEERMAILNAYYLPEGGFKHLYESITPVNTFRTIFDVYFGGEFGRVEDKSLYSQDSHPYDFEEVEASRPECE